MTRYSVLPSDRIYLGYGFLSFAKRMGKNISKNLSSKYSQKLLDHAKKSATDVLKTASWRAVQKTAEVTDELIGDKIANRITKFQKNHNKIIQRQLQMSMIMKYLTKDISLEERRKIIDELRLK